MGGAPNKKTGADPTNSESFAIWWISQAGGIREREAAVAFLDRA
jgi:hypothetical protein